MKRDYSSVAANPEIFLCRFLTTTHSNHGMSEKKTLKNNNKFALFPVNRLTSATMSVTMALLQMQRDCIEIEGKVCGHLCYFKLSY